MNSLLKYFFLVLPFIFFSVLAYTQGKSEEDVKESAGEFFSNQEYSPALPLYSQLLSLYPKDPNYSYRFGACKLFAEKDKEAPLAYLEYGANDPTVEPEAYFFLGKAYHLNYRFDEALTNYKKFDEKGDEKSKEKLLLKRHIEMCENGKKLLKNITDIVVIDKKTLSKSDFFRNYELTEFGGKIIKTPDEFKLPFDIKKKKESIMYLQPNAEIVYFSSYGEEGLNGKDIYFAKKTPDGNWGQPQILQGPVNTEFDEDYAFIHPNGTLYFSSTGHNSMGGYDVFKSTFDETTQQWSYPQNIDFAINTPGDDYLYITDMEEKNAYFSSTRESSENEVTVYRVKVDCIPVDMVIIKGNFISEATKAAKITIEDLKDSKIAGVFNTNANSGDYVLTVPNGGKFKFIVETSESPVTYSGMVDIPRQKTLKALKQEMQLMADNGEQRLIIKNIFDEEVQGDVSVLLAEIYKEKSSLEVNIDEVKLDTVEEEKTEPVVAVKNDSIVSDTAAVTALQVKPEPVIKSENISNDEIIKIAKEDAKNSQREASDLRLETELAYSIANEKNRTSSEKSREAEEFMTGALYSSDPADKQQKLNNAKQLKKESKLYAEQAVAAYNLAREIEKTAAEKQKEADIAFNYAQELENAVQQNSPEATAEKLAQLNEFMEKQKSQPVETNSYSDFGKQIDEKRKETDIQTKLAKKLEDDVKNLESDIKILKTAAAAEKKKKDKERLEEQASILERDLPAMQSEAQTAKEFAENSQKELLSLEKQESILSSVVSQIKSSDKSTVTSLNESDKSKLETEISTSEERIVKLEQELASDTGSKTEPLVSVVNKEEKSDSSAVATAENVTATNVSNEENQVPAGYENYFKQKLESDETLADPVKKEESKAENYENWAKALEKEAAELKQKSEQATDETEKAALQEKAVSLENSAAEKRQLSVKSKESVAQLRSVNTTEVVPDNSQVPEDYESYFKQKMESNETQGDIVKKEESKARDYESWANAMEKDASVLKQKANITSDETEKAALNEKAASLENSAKEKRLLSQESQATAAQLRLSTPTSYETASNTTPDENSAIASYSEKYISTEKNAMNIQNEKDKAVTLAEINKEWANDLSNEIIALQASEDTIQDETKKAERKETIRLLQELKKEKEARAQEYTEKAIETTASEKAGSTQTPVAVINEGEIPADYTPWYESRIQEQEGLADPMVKEESKAIYYETWAKSIEKEILQLKPQADTITNEEEKRGIDEKIARLEMQSREKRDLSLQSNEQAKRLRQSLPETNVASSETNKTAAANASSTERNVSLQDQVFLSKKDAYKKQSESETTPENQTENQIKEEEFNSELYSNWSEAIDKDIQQLKVLRDVTTSEPEKQKFGNMIAESERASMQKRELSRQSKENAARLKEESANASPEITEEQVKIEVEKAESVVTAQQADSLQTEALLKRDKAGQMGFFKRKKKNAMLADAQKTETQSEINREKSELSTERANLISQSATVELSDDLQNKFAYKKLDDRAKALESDALYLDDQAKATKDSLALVKKKKLKDGIFLRASLLEQKAAAKREEASKFSVLSSELKAKEESSFKELLINTVVKAEKNDSMLPFAKMELDSSELETLKENETIKNFSAQRKEYKKLYLQREIEELESAKMRNEAGTQLTQFSSASSGLDTIKDKKIREQYIKDALEFAGQARNKLATADSLNASATSKEKLADVKLRNALEELYASNDLELFRKTLAYQYMQPPDTVLPPVAIVDTLPKDTVPEITVPVIEETFTLGGNAPVYDDKNPIPVNPKYPDGLIWQVQIGAFRNPIPQNLFKGFAPIMGVKVSDGITRYSAGMFKTFATANSARSEIVKLGYKDAFVVAYRDGLRISITEARALIAQGLFPKDISVTPETTVGSGSQEAAPGENSVAQIEGLFFTVQIGVYSKPATDAQLKNVKPVNSEKLNNGTIRYSSGVYKNFTAASEAKNRIVGSGIKDAFVTAYRNGKRISIAEAKNLSGSNTGSGNTVLSPDIPSEVAPAISKPSVSDSDLGNIGSEEGIVFRVQLGPFTGDIPVQEAGAILEFTRKNAKLNRDENGNTIYFAGLFKDFVSAEKLKSMAVNSGLTNAAVVAFNNGVSMDVEEAKKSTNNE